MTPIAPSSQISTQQLFKNLYQVLMQNVGFGKVASTDSGGVPLTYTQDNTNGVMVRVGEATSTLPQKWTAALTDTTIQHSLNRIPIGYIVFRKSGTVDVYSGTASWTTTTICLQATVATVDTHIYIF